MAEVTNYNKEHCNMKHLKKILSIAIIASGIMSGCSSEDILDDISKGENNIDLSNLNWIEGSISTQVQQGSEANGSINTRSEKEVDEYGNPPSKLPDNIDIYIARYIGKDNSLDEKKVIPITKIGSEYKYKYAIEEDTNGILWAIVSNNEEKDTLKILVREDPNIDSKNPKDCFFFTTYNPTYNPEDDPEKNAGSNFYLPKVKKEDDRYFEGNAYVEYGDSRFSSDGHFFIKNPSGTTISEKAKLYYAVQGSATGKPVTDESSITMKRMTTVMTLCTMVVEKYENHYPSSISTINQNSTPEEMIKETDKLFHAALETRQAKLNEEGKDIQLDYEISVGDFFTRKKVLNFFPVHYNFITGPETNSTDRGTFYLCNLNYPAWMDEARNYTFGDAESRSTVYGISSSCDNHPFIPIIRATTIQDATLRLYMGIRKLNTPENAPQNLLTVDVQTDRTGISLEPNKNHQYYLMFTIEDLVDLAVVDAEMKAEMKEQGIITRSSSDKADLVLSSNRLILR